MLNFHSKLASLDALRSNLLPSYSAKILLMQKQRFWNLLCPACLRDYPFVLGKSVFFWQGWWKMGLFLVFAFGFVRQATHNLLSFLKLCFITCPWFSSCSDYTSCYFKYHRLYTTKYKAVGAWHTYALSK